MTHVTAVNHKRRIAIFDDNAVGEILVWQSPSGCEHSAPPVNAPACTGLMVQHPSGERVAVDLKAFQKIVKH